MMLCFQTLDFIRIIFILIDNIYNLLHYKSIVCYMIWIIYIFMPGFESEEVKSQKILVVRGSKISIDIVYQNCSP